MALDLEILQALINKGNAFFKKNAYMDAYSTYDQAVQYIKTCKTESVEPNTVDECKHMAMLKTAMGDCLYREYKDKLKPQHQQLFTETKHALKLAKSQYQEALKWSKEKPTLKNNKKVQAKLETTIYDCSHLLAILSYNYGLELCEHPASIIPYDDFHMGVKCLLMSLNYYYEFSHDEKLLMTTRKKQEKGYKIVIDDLKDFLDVVNKRVKTENLHARAGVSPDTLDKWQAIINFLLIEKIILMRIAKIENSNNNTGEIDEKISDFYSFRAQQKNNDDLILAIEHFNLAAVSPVDFLNERNIKIYLSVIRCYIEMIKAMSTTNEKEKFVREMKEIISATRPGNSTYISDVDSLELSYYRFQMYLEIKQHEETQKFAKEFIFWYERLCNKEASVLNFEQGYLAAKEYLKKCEDGKAVTEKTELNKEDSLTYKRKRTPEENIQLECESSSHTSSTVKILRATGGVIKGANSSVVNTKRSVKTLEIVETIETVETMPEVVIQDQLSSTQKVDSNLTGKQDTSGESSQRRTPGTFQSVLDKKRGLVRRF